MLRLASAVGKVSCYLGRCTLSSRTSLTPKETDDIRPYARINAERGTSWTVILDSQKR